MKYLLNIFDLDGTLIDSHIAISMAINNILSDMDLPVRDPQELKKFIGSPLEDMMKTVGIEDIKKGMESYRRYYFQYIKDYQKAFPGIKETLDRLKNKLPLAIATNKGRPGALLSLEWAGLSGYFDVIITTEEIKRLKPDPEAYQKIIKFYRSEGKFIDKEDILMIGDSTIDMEFAANSGISGAFAKWGFYKPEDLTVNPAYLLNSPEELIKINGIDEIVEIEVSNELDLHIFMPKDAAPLVRDYIYSVYKKGLKKVRIIHGKGTGVQKRMVHEILKSNKFVKDFYDAPQYIGGFGATIVELNIDNK